jgi:hypothetical protein
MTRTVADQFAETLVAAGVKRIYGIVGDSLNGLTDSIRRQGKIEWVHVRHEEVAAFAAGAEAHLTGELAVCAGSCGPGNMHLINGLFDCHRSRVPILAIAAQIPSSEIGTGYFQETHPEQLSEKARAHRHDERPLPQGPRRQNAPWAARPHRTGPFRWRTLLCKRGPDPQSMLRVGGRTNRAYMLTRMTPLTPFITFNSILERGRKVLA